VSVALLRVEALSKRYGDLEALRDVTLELSAGELVALVGPNGAGKTTLLSIIAGGQRASAGSVAPKGMRIGWAPQQAALYARLTVAENLRLFARLEHVADVEAAVARMLAQTGLEQRADERVERLSGGNRQRVNVALGLIADPPVLALDEPSAALDPAQRERLWEFLTALVADGTAVLFSTHNVSEAQRYATRVLVLDGGRLLFDGTPTELMRAAEERASPPADLEHTLVRYLERQHCGGRA
jgi:ABC-2 type transport system ATP-binding protein